MAAIVQFQTQLSYRQVADLARQLPPRDKQKLAKLLAKESEQTTDNKPETKLDPAPISLEDQLSPAQHKTWANIKQGFEELKLVQEGKIEARPLADLLNEL
jgi:hypothetical protein